MEEAVVGRALRRATWLRPRPSCSVDASSASPSSTLRPPIIPMRRVSRAHGTGLRGTPPRTGQCWRRRPGCASPWTTAALPLPNEAPHTRRVSVSGCQRVRVSGSGGFMRCVRSGCRRTGFGGLLVCTVRASLERTCRLCCQPTSAQPRTRQLNEHVSVVSNPGRAARVRRSSSAKLQCDSLPWLLVMRLPEMVWGCRDKAVPSPRVSSFGPTDPKTVSQGPYRRRGAGPLAADVEVRLVGVRGNGRLPCRRLRGPGRVVAAHRKVRRRRRGCRGPAAGLGLQPSQSRGPDGHQGSGRAQCATQ